MRTESTIYRSAVRRRRFAPTLALLRLGIGVVVLLVLAAVIGMLFAGSTSTLAAGTKIAGINVGGMTANEATRLLRAKSQAVERVPVPFTAGGETFRVSASQLGVRANWQAAVRAAAAEGDGFGPLRGFRRLRLRLFGADVAPPLTAYNASLAYELQQIGVAVDRPSIDAKLVRRGLAFSIAAGSPGVMLEREGAGRAIVQALGSLDRKAGGITLPVEATTPSLRQADLRVAVAQARTALSAPIRLTDGETTWRLPRWRIAALLQLPIAGAPRVTIGGPGAERYLERLSRTLSRKPADARFQVTAAGTVVIIPAKPGLQLDVPATAKAVTAAALSPTLRTARLAVIEAVPERTTAEARKMGITGVVSSYTTTYGGTPGRLHNVQLVAQLIDGALIAPGGTFSFNGTTGERTVEKGFEEAPVIINGELQNGIGGGVCQVSTTVFNAAYEAGVPIEARTNHALYISHYPLGRDATVNYPDLDLKFKNDTEHWLLLRTFVGSGSLTINLYGSPVHRRVESSTAPLSVIGAVPLRQIKDPTLKKGKRVVEQAGAPPRATSVQRRVYDADGKLLYDTTWRSSYVGEPMVVRVGTKKPPKKRPGTNAATRNPPAVADVTGPPAAGGAVAPVSPPSLP